MGGARGIWTKALGHGVHFDRAVDVCFFTVVSGIQRGLFFGPSSSGHVRVPSIPHGERGKGGGLFRKRTVVGAALAHG
jgi:hypothetical protein